MSYIGFLRILGEYLNIGQSACFEIYSEVVFVCFILLGALFFTKIVAVPSIEIKNVIIFTLSNNIANISPFI